MGRTTLVVTHRLGICREVDRIIVLKEGQVAEDGSHSELLQLGGLYAQLFHAQARWYLPGEETTLREAISKAIG